MKNNYLLLLLALWLTACNSLAGDRDRRDGTSSEPTPIPTTVAAARPTYEVQRGEVIYQVEVPGRVAPLVEQALAFTQAGIVNQVLVERGDEVTAGDLIATLDTSGWEAELVLAQSALAIATAQRDSSEQEIIQARREAELRRDLAQLDLNFALGQAASPPTEAQQYEIDRLTILLELAQLEVDALVTTIDPELQADVDAAALRVAQLESLIAQADLIAPLTGTLSTLNLSEGRAVAVGESVGTISDPSQIEVISNLRDDQLVELAEGLVAEITPASTPGSALSGAIRRLPYPFGSGGTASVADADTSTRIQFDDMNAALAIYEPGDRVDIRILITQKDDVLWLPPAAIRDFSGRKFVVVQNGDIQQRVDVTLGIAGNGRVEILEGVEAGQIIVGQ